MHEIKIKRDEIPYWGLSYMHCGFCEKWNLETEKCKIGLHPRYYFCSELNENFYMRKGCIGTNWEEAKDVEIVANGTLFSNY